MYLVIVNYKYEGDDSKVFKTKKEVKQFIKERQRDADGFEIYKVTKELPVEDFK